MQHDATLCPVQFSEKIVMPPLRRHASARRVLSYGPGFAESTP